MKHNNKPNLLYFESWMKGHAIDLLKDDNSINLIHENFSNNCTFTVTLTLSVFKKEDFIK